MCKRDVFCAFSCIENRFSNQEEGEGQEEARGVEGERERGFLMLRQYCSTVLPMEGIGIEIEIEGEREREREITESPGSKTPRVRAETSLHSTAVGGLNGKQQGWRERERLNRKDTEGGREVDVV